MAAMSFRIRALLPLWLLAGQVSCGSMAAWWTDLGPSLLVQDEESGNIRYSLCNSQDTPILPEDKTITAPLFKYKPKNGTALAGTGWWDHQQTWASIFYQDEGDDIINSLLKCDTNTGYWLNTGDWIVSDGAPSISNSTGLAAVLLGSNDGYRVYYHDTNNTLCQLGYTSDTEWDYKGSVSHDGKLGNAIAAAWSKNKNITVATPKDGENIEVSRFFDDNLWHVTTFPRPLSGNLTTNATNATNISLNATSTLNFTLPAWDGAPGALGLGIDKAATRSLFYIGTDAELYQLAQVDGQWRAYARENATQWPRADAAKAPLAVAYDPQSSSLRVFYQSGGQVVQLHGDGGSWAAAAVLPNANSTAAKPTPSSSASADASSTAGAAGGLSTGAKAGVGVGVSLGVVAVGGMIGALFLLRKRQQRRDAAAEAATMGGGSTVGGSTMVQTPVPAYSPLSGHLDHASQQNGGYGHGGYDAHGNWTYKPVEKPPGELDSYAPAVHEMPETRMHHEMIGEGHYREAP
ncbi:uncharacterized protein JN550_001428 [Neoarthrinium moseri]|uniref:uncharacterized protein n=1 Tax=Neoarthrinium moseri TaxID=1658444 RepID=UPI001FDC983D|nr:uncharacterized protein JN550_001428 [Neoarthrinium moseri]KAI1875932.1 hypothetical protein JN550_001428 [Neoarthrinium moseri]